MREESITNTGSVVTAGMLVQQYEEGSTATEIAAKYGISLPTVLAHLHSKGVKVRRGRRTTCTSAESFKWLDRHLSGESLQAIADEHGLTRERVRQVCASAALFRLREQSSAQTAD